ncbi:MAG: AAA family ATPase [Gemmataceae bacterium]
MLTISREATVRPLAGGHAKLGATIVGAKSVPTDQYLEIHNGPNTVYCRVVGPPQSPHLGEDDICLDEWQRGQLAVREGERVEVTGLSREKIEALTQLDLVVNEKLPTSTSKEQVSEFITKKRFPLYPGFRFEFAPPGVPSRLLFQVKRCRGERGTLGFGLCTDETEIRIKVGQVGLKHEEAVVSYDDIGGLEDEIRIVRETLEVPIRMRNSMRRIGVSPPTGVIFYGTPGTGKTLLARAIAYEANVPIHQLSPSDLYAAGVRDPEAKLNAVFDQAEAHPEGSIIVIDELDFIAGQRGGQGHGDRANLSTMLLARLDALNNKGNVMVIGTTNRLDAIDDGLRRHGRFSREIPIPAPHETGRMHILQIHTRRMPLATEGEEAQDELLGKVARRTHGYVGADLEELCREAGLNALRRVHPIDVLDRGELAPQAPLAITAADFDNALTVVKPSALKEVMVSVPDVSFADIAGLEHVLEDIQERVLRPLKEPDVFRAMGLAPERGILLYGPPGTGKTMLAKAIANECGANFLAIQGPELLSKWVGESEEGVRKVFARARQLAPSIVFFDEIEALLPARGSHANDSGVSDRVVNQFLAELDGVVELGAVSLIAATNRPEMIDPAAVRSGRLGTHIEVPLPDEKGRGQILSLYLRGSLEGEPIERLAQETEGLSGADLAEICRNAKRIALRSVNYAQITPVTAEHLQKSWTEFRNRSKPWRV